MRDRPPAAARSSGSIPGAAWRCTTASRWRTTCWALLASSSATRAGLLLGWVLGLAYLGFAVVQMWVLMPLQVCPRCVYRRMDGSRCISALNVVSGRIAPLVDENRFPERGKGVLCHNNLYLAALIAPLMLIVPALVLDFSWLVLAILFAVGALLAFRMMVLFPQVACGHCAARGRCPNAQAMGIG